MNGSPIVPTRRFDRVGPSGPSPVAVAVAVASFVVALFWWPLVLVLVLAIAALVRVRPLLEDRDRRRRMAHALPEVIDLIMIAVSSGATITGSVRVVANEGPPPVRSGFLVALEHMRAGSTLAEGLHRASDALGPEYGSLMVALTQAEREGSPLGALLIRLADEATVARRRRAELAARQLPVQMLVPLVLCSLPAVVLGAVVPLLIVSLRRL